MTLSDLFAWLDRTDDLDAVASLDPAFTEPRGGHVIPSHVLIRADSPDGPRLVLIPLHDQPDGSRRLVSEAARLFAIPDDPVALCQTYCVQLWLAQEDLETLGLDAASL